MPGFFRTPNSVFDMGLTSSELLVLVYLCRCASNKTGSAFPSYTTIAKRCHISRRTAIVAIKSLEAKHIIKIERHFKQPNVYSLGAILH